MRILILFSLLFLMGCTQTWEDMTPQNRGLPELKMDDAICDQYAHSIPIPTANCYNCVGLVVSTAIMMVHNAYENCMTSRGWGKVTAYSSSSTVRGFTPVPNQSLEYCCPGSQLSLDKYGGRTCSNGQLLCVGYQSSSCSCE